MDTTILKFIGENWLTIYMAITMLKGIALITPSVHDDKIVTLLCQTYDVLRGGQPPNKIDHFPCAQVEDGRDKPKPS